MISLPARVPLSLVVLTLLAAAPAMAQNRPAAGAQAKPASGNAPAQAKQTGFVQQYDDWSVFHIKGANGSHCYAASKASKRDLASLKTTPAYLLISTQPKSNIRNEVSVVMGYKVKPSSDAALQIGSSSFVLYTKDEGAWVKNPAEEAKIVQALRGGSSVTVKATSLRGNTAIDTYSLAGLGKALERVAQECR